jgi:hypothetical protein
VTSQLSQMGRVKEGIYKSRYPGPVRQEGTNHKSWEITPMVLSLQFTDTNAQIGRLKFDVSRFSGLLGVSRVGHTFSHHRRNIKVLRPLLLHSLLTLIYLPLTKPLDSNCRIHNTHSFVPDDYGTQDNGHQYYCAPAAPFWAICLCSISHCSISHRRISYCWVLHHWFLAIHCPGDGAEVVQHNSFRPKPVDNHNDGVHHEHSGSLHYS